MKHMNIFITLSRNKGFKNYVYLFVVYVCIYMKVRGNFEELGLPFHQVGFGIWTQMVMLSSECPSHTELRSESVSMMGMQG